jgi:protoheme IX farnesyltransferase
MNSTIARMDGVIAVPAAEGWRGRLVDYYELTKPRIILLLLVVTAASMVMAAHGFPPLGIFLATLAGGALAAGSSGAYNCAIDRDIDPLMRRTMLRPVPLGRITPRQAFIFASLTGAISFALFYFWVNPFAAWLSLGGELYYVLIYSLWLKRVTTANIVIGGAAGAIPALVGWAAVTNGLGGPALGLFALVFLWTPPHFWSLALMVETDYHKANIPMLPNVKGVRRTTIEIFVYSVILVVSSLSLTFLGVMGLPYLATAAVLGGVFLYDAYMIFAGPTKQRARSMFKYSLLYLALMSAAMVIDRLLAVIPH